MSETEQTPRFRRGVKFRYDDTRGAWVLLAPEKLFLPDDVAVEVLKRVDGKATTAHIIDDLAKAFNAPREVIAVDVAAMLRDLSDKGALSL